MGGTGSSKENSAKNRPAGEGGKPSFYPPRLLLHSFPFFCRPVRREEFADLPLRRFKGGAEFRYYRMVGVPLPSFGHGV